MPRATRYSKKREAILSVLRDTKSHPSAEWVYQKLKPTHPDLSLGTVYRNLALFREQGVIQSVGVVEGQERFDADTSLHHHFVCQCCGSVIDLAFSPAQEDSWDQAVSQQYGFRTLRHELVFYGICNECQKETNEINEEEQNNEKVGL